MVQMVEKYDLLGIILEIVTRFIASDFNMETVYREPVTQSNVTGADLFERQGEKVFVRADFLPGTLAILAIGFHQKAIHLETGVWNEEVLLEVLEKTGLTRVQAKSGGVIRNNTQTLLTYSSPVVPEAVEGITFQPRILCTIPISTLSLPALTETIALLDELFKHGAWNEGSVKEVDQTPQGPVEPALRLEQSMKLVYTLQAEQRPILALRQANALQTEARLEMQQTLTVLFAYQNRILTALNDSSTLQTILVEYEEKYGTEGLKNLTIFVMAARVHKARPTLSWKQARAVARGIVKNHQKKKVSA